MGNSAADGAADTATRACAIGDAPRPGDGPRYALVRAVGAGIHAPRHGDGPRYALVRAVGAGILGFAGLVAYNWWLLVPLRPGLMTSPDELFSNLEVAGQPYAAVMQHADLAAGLLMLAAFALTGPDSWRRGRREWLAMLGFAAAGVLGGLYPEVCADGISAACRRLEYRFQLPAAQYVHMAAGIVEFAAITVAAFCAAARTRRTDSRVAHVYRLLARASFIAYPLLGASYLTDRLGGIMEAVFFAGFTVMAATQLIERTCALRSPREAEDDLPDSAGPGPEPIRVTVTP